MSTIYGQFNPGRQLRDGPDSGIIVVNVELLDLVASGAPPIVLNVRGTLQPPLTPLELLKLEMLHELDARLFLRGLLRGGAACLAQPGNFLVSCATVRLNPDLDRTFRIWGHDEAQACPVCVPEP